MGGRGNPAPCSQWRSSEPGSVAKLDLLQTPALPLTSHVSLSLCLLTCDTAVVTEPSTCWAVVRIYGDTPRVVPEAQEVPSVEA